MTAPADSPGPRTGRLRPALQAAVLVFIGLWTARVFLGDVFCVRTASMAPTVAGSPAGGDCVVLSRLHGRVAPPQRFEVLLFRYPNNTSLSFMKRLVAFGGEQLLIRGGDLYLGDPDFAGGLEEGLEGGRVVLLRKPPAVTEALLDGLPVFPPPASGTWGRRELERDLVPVEGACRISGSAEGAVVLEAEGPFLWRTRHEPTDALPAPAAEAEEPAPPPTPAGEARRLPPVLVRRAVGDLSLRVTLRLLGGTGSLLLGLDDARHPAAVRLELPLERGDTARLTLGGREMATFPSPLVPGAVTHLRLDNVDNRLRVLVDHGTVVTRDYVHPPAPEDRSDASRGAGALLGGRSLRVELLDVSLHRDVHYLQDGPGRFLVPPGHLLFLGDNPAASSDSRSWRRSAIEVLGTGEILQGDAQGLTLWSLHPYGSNPWREPDGSWGFVDILGRTHRFTSESAFRRLGTWRTPYVPRENVSGRGLLVATPLDRTRLLR